MDKVHYQRKTYKKNIVKKMAKCKSVNGIIKDVVADTIDDTRTVPVSNSYLNSLRRDSFAYSGFWPHNGGIEYVKPQPRARAIPCTHQ